MFALQPLLRAGVFEPGPRLTCSVSGVVYTAHLGVNGEIKCLCGCSETFRSPSAFSVHIKRKANALRKADDGWTSTKYMGVTLGAYRSQLEELLSQERTSNSKGSGTTSSETAVLLSQVVKQKRKVRGPRSTTKTKHHSSSNIADESKHSQQRLPSTDPQQAQGSKQKPADHTQGHVEQQQRSLQSPMRPSCELILSSQGMDALWRSARLPEADLQYTWVQCSNPDCHKWRQVKNSSSSFCRNWVCSDVMVDGLQVFDCRQPQQLPDLQVQWLLQDEAAKKFAAVSSRPNLEACDGQQFEADLIAFLTAKGDEQLAALVRDNRITCNNSPLDLFGLYREVVRRGGLVDNERYDDRGRWSGGINFAGDVFRRLSNFTPNNRATSVGNQLLNNYKKFLLSYERAYRSKDIQAAAKSGGGAATTPAGTAPPTLVLPSAAAGGDAGNAGILSRHKSAVPAADGSHTESDNDVGPDTLYSVSDGDDDVLDHNSDDDSNNAGTMQAPDPLAMLARAALVSSPGKQRQQQQQQGHMTAPQEAVADPERLTKRRRLGPAELTDSNKAHTVLTGNVLQQRQQEQVCQHDDCTQRSIAGSTAYVLELQAAAFHAMSAHTAAVETWCVPGSLVLVEDRRQQQQQQQQGGGVSAAVVADISQLPLSLAQTAAAVPAACGGLDSTSHLEGLSSSSSRNSSSCSLQGSCLPVLVLGSRRLCWVPVSSCKPLTLHNAQAALASAWRDAPGDMMGRTNGSNVLLTSQNSSSIGDCIDHSQQCSRTALWQEQQQQHTVSNWLERTRGLKQAVQWVSCGNGISNSSRVTSTAHAPTRWVTAAGCAAVAADLLELEGQLPFAGVSNSSSAFWEVWHEAVQSASTSEQLAHQVLLLAYQLKSHLLLPGAAEDLWKELQQLLGITQCQHTAACQDSTHGHSSDQQQHSQEQQEQQQQPCQASCKSCTPSVLSISEAVRVMRQTVDWSRARQLWQADTVEYCNQQHSDVAAEGLAGMMTCDGAAVAAADQEQVQQTPVQHLSAATPLLLPLFKTHLQHEKEACSSERQAAAATLHATLGADGCDVQQLLSLLLSAAVDLTAAEAPAPAQELSAVTGADLSPAWSAAATLGQQTAVRNSTFCSSSSSSDSNA